MVRSPPATGIFGPVWRRAGGATDGPCHRAGEGTRGVKPVPRLVKRWAPSWSLSSAQRREACLDGPVSRPDPRGTSRPGKILRSSSKLCLYPGVGAEVGEVGGGPSVWSSVALSPSSSSIAPWRSPPFLWDRHGGWILDVVAHGFPSNRVGRGWI